MRARNLKPGLFKNEILGEADPLLTILFEGLWCMADRAGRLKDLPLRICAELFPYRRKLKENHIDEMLWWLVERKFIARYENSDGRFIQVLEFAKHQSPHKSERASEIQELRSDSHRTRTLPARGHARRLTEAAALTPDSGLLTADCGLLTEDSPHPMQAPAESGIENRVSGAMEVKPPPEPLSQSAHMARLDSLKAIYPKGIYRQSEWQLVEREVDRAEEDGEVFEVIFAGAQRYRAQCDATGSTSTQYVTSPVKFVQERHFLEPFPLPEKRAPTARKTYADYDREAAERLASLPGDDPGPM